MNVCTRLWHLTSKPRTWLMQVVGLCSLLFVLSASALDSTVPLASYHHDMWTAKDGALAEVVAIAQALDGWISLGTPSGLYRFDGIKFRRFEPAVGAPGPKRAIVSLTALTSGGLLIGHQNAGLGLLLSMASILA